MSDAGMPKLVTTTWLAERLTEDDLRVFDCTVEFEQTAEGVRTGSGRPSWARSHIPGSGFLDILEDLSDASSPLPAMAPPAAQFADVLGRAGVGPETRVVLYDRSSGMWAARVWWMLRAMGFDAAGVLSGGFSAWTTEGRPVSAEPAAYPRTQFIARPRPKLFAGKEEVRAALGDDRVLLLNALAPEIFAGKVAPFGRAGRIPGSRNVPAGSLLDASGAFRQLADLRAAFEAEGALGAPRVIAYCGGGIAACADAFALTLLGHDDVAVYDGSLADWANDPTCPMETDAP
jgi:thiosulfate/3-mercaptopyruvate sulfurtransferase